jgi:hypothetical protein
MTDKVPLSIWQCPTCARSYGNDVVNCPSPKCTGIPYRAEQERTLFDAIRRAGLVEAALYVFASDESNGNNDACDVGALMRRIQNRLEMYK